MIYADNAATTRLSEEALQKMLPWLTENYGNASTLYRMGREAHRAVEQAREEIEKGIGASPMEILFTSGGTESDNWALKGTMRHLARKGKKHLITSAIEHHAVLHSAHALEKEGYDITVLPVSKEGFVDPDSVKKAIRPDTALVSIMYANNETGVVQPVTEIGAVCREAGVLFHTDAVQAAGILPIDVKEQKIDLLSASAHKFHGPKGVGFLFCRRKAVPDTLLDGGGQERGHRSGTENVAGIVGMAAAFSQALSEREEKTERLSALRDRVQEGLLKIPGTHLNGDASRRLPGTLNVSFEDLDGQSLLMELDLRGIQASVGSACNSGSMTPSHVLLEMGVPYKTAHGSLRLSFGRYNRPEEAETLVRKAESAVRLLRDRR